MTTYVHVCENQTSQALIKRLKMSTVWVKSAFGVAGTGSGHWGAAGRRPGWMSRVRSWLLRIVVTQPQLPCLYIHVFGRDPWFLMKGGGRGAVLFPGDSGQCPEKLFVTLWGGRCQWHLVRRGQDAAEQPEGHRAARLPAVLPPPLRPFPVPALQLRLRGSLAHASFPGGTRRHCAKAHAPACSLGLSPW